MILTRRIQSRTLIVFGLVTMAVRALLQSLVDRSGHSTSLTDFAFGVMLGIGIGLTLLGIWRKTREDRNASPDVC